MKIAIKGFKRFKKKIAGNFYFLFAIRYNLRNITVSFFPNVHVYRFYSVTELGSIHRIALIFSWICFSTGIEYCKEINSKKYEDLLNERKIIEIET